MSLLSSILRGRFLTRFRRSRSGNVAMLWALVGTALVGTVGLTIDFTRAQSIRTQMQNAADGAALVAERSSNLTLAQRTDAARAYFDQSFGAHQPIEGAINFRVVPLEHGGHRVEASGMFDNGLSLVARLLGNSAAGNWTISVAAEAMADASPPIEVALVLDNTGSMANDMTALRSAATDLANSLYDLGGQSVSVALVPFVAQVNIGNNATTRQWMDLNGNAPYNGAIFEDRQIGRRTWASSSGASCQSLNTLPFTGYSGPYRIRWIRQTSVLQGDTCRAFTPLQINYFDLFSLVPNAPWGGCVEARPEPYDVTDDPPSSANASTLFVPFFWADTLDSTYNNNNNSSNNYLTDSSGNITSVTSPSVTMTDGYSTNPGNNTGEKRRAMFFNIFKYRGNNGSLDTTYPDTVGPNKGCPTPIVPLTLTRNDILTGISNMRHWNGGGTNQAEGLAWGWRVLSPGAPFTQGRPYDDPNNPVRKVIVLMSDGQNTNVGSDTVMSSDYSSYNHLGLWTQYADGSLLSGLYGLIGGILHGLLPEQFRRPITSSADFVDYINDRERAVCTNIKHQGVEIYTVIFRETDGDTRDLMRSCATDNDHYFTANNQQELAQAFHAIGSGIGQLRLTH